MVSYLVDYEKKYLKYKFKYKSINGGAQQLSESITIITDSSCPASYTYIGFYNNGPIDIYCNCGWLGNHYEDLIHTISYNGKNFKNAGSAFLACKFWRNVDKFTGLTYEEAIKLNKDSLLGKPDKNYNITTRDEDTFNSHNLQAMYDILYIKFSTNEDLKQKLLTTKDAILIEHNKDKVWSNNENGTGSNALGLLLMIIRIQINDSKTDTDIQMLNYYFSILYELTGNDTANLYKIPPTFHTIWWQKMIIRGTRLIHNKLHELNPSCDGMTISSLLFRSSQSPKIPEDPPTDTYGKYYKIPLYNIKYDKIFTYARDKIKLLKQSGNIHYHPYIKFIEYHKPNNKLRIVFSHPISEENEKLYTSKWNDAILNDSINGIGYFSIIILNKINNFK